MYNYPMAMKQELEKYNSTYSAERLTAFAYSATDKIDDIVNNYSNNIKIAQAMYPELCVLEVILRNSIDSILKKYISPTWIEDEVNNQGFLDNSEHSVLLKTYNDTVDECK